METEAELPSPLSVAAAARWSGAPLSLGLHAATLLLLWLLPPFDRSAGDPVVTVSIVAESPAPPQPLPQPSPEAASQTPAPLPQPPARPRSAPSPRPASVARPVPVPAAVAVAVPAIPAENRPAEAAPPSGAPDSAEVDTAAANAYGLAVWQRIRQHRPLWARKFTGQVLIAFAIARDGSLLSVDIARSSGSRRHDDAAVEAVRAAAPFPAPPPAAGDGRMRFTIPFQFQ